MNKEWSDLNKSIQLKLKKEVTFNEAIDTLLELRNTLAKETEQWKNELTKEDFYAIPFINANGYHSKTIAYSLWHISRIEDIVVHTLINKDDQIFFKNDYQRKINSSIITTGNELFKEEISEFSKYLNIDMLYQYFNDVKLSTDSLLRTLKYSDLKKKFDEKDRKNIQEIQVVSSDEKAVWLIDYWCNKDVKGLLQMPLSRHWIMHIEAGMRIKDRIKKP